MAGTTSLLLKCLILVFVLNPRRAVGGGTVPGIPAVSLSEVLAGREEAEELVRLVSGRKVDAASLSGLEANLLTREGVSAPEEGGCDMIGYFWEYDISKVYIGCGMI